VNDHDVHVFVVAVVVHLNCKCKDGLVRLDPEEKCKKVAQFENSVLSFD
jgi:hypothetical protein